MNFSLAEVLEDEDLRHREFPVAKGRTYFAHAAVAPFPQRVATAMERYLARAAQEGQFGHLHADILDRTRISLARLLEVTTEEIAFVNSTSVGLSLVAGGLDWRSGDSVVIPAAEFPANLHPWLALQRRGVKVRFIPHRPEKGIDAEDVARLLDGTTRLVSLSSLHYLTGRPTDVEGVGKLLGERGVLFCLDAIQSLAALPLSARHADFVTAGAQKWLLGPQGIGLLSINRTRLQDVQPMLLGWKTVGQDRGIESRSIPLSAERYEPGTLNVMGVVGLEAALELIEMVGRAAISDRLMILHRQFLEGLQLLGYDVLGGYRREDPTCITSFTHHRLDLGGLRRELEERDRPIILSQRRDQTGTTILRFAPHFYNTAQEVEALLDVLKSATKSLGLAGATANASAQDQPR